jgi:hypothetical protein
MIWSIPTLQDTTIYETDPYRNTGLDQILELRKEGDNSTGDLSESRILIKFDLSSLSSILSDNSISINNITADLKLYTVQEFEVPQSYNIEAKAVSNAWVNGTGYLTSPAGIQNSDSITDGATWKSVSGTGSLNWSDITTAGTARAYNIETGGGSWYTASIVSQSFNFKTDDTLSIDVTNIVKSWYTGSMTNNGFLVTFKNSEITTAHWPKTVMQFYGSDTHTVYEPQLFINWTGSLYNTGSLSVITYEDNPIVYVNAFKGEFLKDKKVRISLGARPKYPRPAFTQNSTFATLKALPETSYYQIKDAHNDNIIIPYSDYTKISTTSAGSYFDLYTTMLYGERFYKFEIKSVFDGVTEYFSSNDFTFKIVK